jgi:hypothetical protein
MADELRKEVIISVKTDTTEATQGVDQLQTDLNQLNETEIDKPFKALKSQLKEANVEAQRVAEQFGINSKQFREAATRVEELKGKFDEVNIAVKAFNPDNKLQSLVSVSQGAVGAIQGVTGAFQFLGIQSGSAEQAIARLQGLMAFSDALNSVGDIKDSFNAFGSVIQSTTAFQKLNATATAITAGAIKLLGGAATTSSTGFKVLRGAIIGTGIGALVIGLVALIQNFEEVKKVLFNLIPGLADVAEVVGNIVQQFTDWVGITSAADRELEKLNATTARTNENLETQLKINSAIGGKDKENFLIKKQINENELTALREKLRLTGELTAEEQKQFRELKTSRTILDIEEQNRLKKAATPTVTKSSGGKTSVKSSGGENPRVTAERDITQFLANEQEERLRLSRTALDNELLEIQKSYDAKIALARKYNLDTKTLEQERFNQQQIAISNNVQIENDGFDEKLFKAKEFEPAIREVNVKRNTSETELAEAEIEVDKRKTEARMENIALVGNALSGFAELAGKQTVAGKAIAIAQTTISTFQAAQSSYTSLSSIPIVGPVLGVAAAAAAVAAGVLNVKKILAVKVPGKGSGGSAPSISASASAPAINSTILAPQNVQDVRVTNNGQQPIRAFIVDRDLANNEAKNKFLNNLSSF